MCWRGTVGGTLEGSAVCGVRDGEEEKGYILLGTYSILKAVPEVSAGRGCTDENTM